MSVCQKITKKWEFLRTNRNDLNITMKIFTGFLQKKYVQVDLGQNKIEEIPIDQIQNGRPLSLFLCLLLVICCSSWTATAYFASRIPNDKCVQVPNELRFDCHPDINANQDTCLKRGCCWSTPNAGGQVLDLNIPYCYYPNGYSLYTKTFVSENEDIYEYKNVQASGFPDDVQDVQVHLSCFDKKILRIQILDKNAKRFQVPYTNFDNKSRALTDCDLQVLMDKSGLDFQVVRKNGNVIFDTYNAGGFIFADQFLQISSILPTNFVYGLGEHRKPFLKNAQKWQQYSFWNADQWPSDQSTNLYGSHPFYINMDPETKSGIDHFVQNAEKSFDRKVLSKSHATSHRFLNT